MKKHMRKILSIVTTLAVMLTLLVPSLALAAPGIERPEWPDAGAINLTKEAQKVEKTNDEWEITLTVEGKNLKTGAATDCVIVLDKSGSMAGGGMAAVKSAAIKLVNQLLKDETGSRIAVVVYDGEAKTLVEFKGYNNRQDIISAINKMSNDPAGGTNIQSGIKMATDLLAGSTSGNKTMVVLSDGEPTYSYPAKTATNYSGFTSTDGMPAHNFKLSDFAYTRTEWFLFWSWEVDNSIGSGSSYDLSTGWGGSAYTVDGKQVKDNGIATISQAQMAKDAGITLYSVGYNTAGNKEAKYVMRNIASDEQKFFEASAADIDAKFAEIGDKIAYAATDAVVVDKMGEMFDLILGEDNAFLVGEQFNVSQGTVELDPSDSNRFIWNVGVIRENAKATMTYKVKMKAEADPDTNYPTNAYANISYKNVYGQADTGVFESPIVSKAGGTIQVQGYWTDTEGYPLNSKGERLGMDEKDKAHKVFTPYYHEDDGKDVLNFGIPYTITVPTVSGYETDFVASPITLSPADPNQVVWIPYITEGAVDLITISVKYVNKYDESIVLDTALLTGNPGNPYTVDEKANITHLGTDYKFVETVDANGGTFGSVNGTEILVKYTPATTVSVKYVNKLDYTEVLEEQFLNGYAGEGYTVDTGKIYAGYDLADPAVEDVNNGVYPVEKGTVVYVLYDRDPNNKYDVDYVVRHQVWDEESHSFRLVHTENLTGKEGDVINSTDLKLLPDLVEELKDMDLSDFDVKFDKTHLTLVKGGTEADNVITVSYEPKATVEYQVIHEVWNEETESFELIKQDDKTGKAGDVITSADVALADGYTAEKYDITYTGTPLTLKVEGEMVIVVQYTPFEEIGDDTPPLDDGKKNDPTDDLEEIKDGETPKTGAAMPIMGALAILVLAGGTLIVMKKRDREDI